MVNSLGFSRETTSGCGEPLWKSLGLSREATVVGNSFVEASRPLEGDNYCEESFVEATQHPEGYNKKQWKPLCGSLGAFRRRQPTAVENLCRSHEASRGRQRTVVEIICGNLEASRGRRLLLGTFVEAPRPLEGDSERLQKTFLEILRLSRETTNGCGQPLWTSGNGYNEPMQKLRVLGGRYNSWVSK